MARPGIQMLTWTLWIFCWIHVGRVLAEPHYRVIIPAVLEAGAETRFCASLLQPNESLVMTVTLKFQDENKNKILLEKTSSEEFHECVQFQVPLVTNEEEVQNLQVEVRGDTFYSQKVMKVKIKVYKAGTFVQTDKPIYLPGQTVHFRVVSMDNKFRPVNQQYRVIELQDPEMNRIGQWLNENSNGKVLQRSYTLNSEAPEGSYQITVKMGKDEVFGHFKVEKYVLPKFDVKVKLKEEVNILQEEFEVEVCSKYTYGQPVPGTVTVKVCRPYHRYVTFTRFGEIEEDSSETALCDTKIIQADKNGCDTFIFKMSAFTGSGDRGLEDILDVSVTVEEDGTGVSRPQGKRLKISQVVGRLSFFDTPKIYSRGSVVEGKVKAAYHNDTPIPDMTLYLFEGEPPHYNPGPIPVRIPEEWWPKRKLLQNLKTDSDGVAVFTLNTTTFGRNMHLLVGSSSRDQYRGYKGPSYEPGTHTMSELLDPSPDTKTISSLEVKTKNKPLLCDTEEDISIQYTLIKEVQGTVDLMYLILSRGAIIMQGLKQIQLQDQSVNEGEVSFKLTVTPDMAPEVQVVAYAVLPSNNLIAHRTNFPTEKCFSNKVSLEFSPPSAVPGEATNIQLTAQPHSLCAMSAVDQSVLIKEPGKTLSAEKIFNVLPVSGASSVPRELQDPVDCSLNRWRRSVPIYHRRRTGETFADEVFKNVGLKMATNLWIDKCIFYDIPYLVKAFTEDVQFSPPVMTGSSASGSRKISPPPPPIQTARSFFPETWIWDLVEVGESGTKDVSFTVPDTITSWETDTFCLSPQGFGLAPRKKLTVFQPFFLELTLPYSIIRGENFELKATVFNYLPSCIMVKVTAAPSSDYTLTPLSGDRYTSCLCGSERLTLSWTMIPSTLGVVNVTVTAEAVPSQTSCDNEIVSVPERGRIDVVTRPLRVKAEGTEITKTHNWLLCPKGKTVTEERQTELPDNVIDGSVRATVSVLGDILGRAMNNLDGLLRMPYGCGEQNMALLAPNIYILHYLKNTQQLTPAIKEKASNFLINGYQRQLNYKDMEGAYSTFGSGPGNTWLTAFVLRSFFQAQTFVYIDPAVMKESMTWLQQKQRPNGCFEKSGKLFNNRMKGGVSDEVTLSAYITAAFLEMNMSTDDPVVKMSLSCLKASISDLKNTYTSALLAYVFTLAGDTEAQAFLLQHLDSVAIKEGAFIHWSQTASETSDSLSVEISSYVLMARLSASSAAEDLGYASAIVRWLTGQQNHYGGFSSTQDTVVALQALALYSTAVFSPEGSSTVTVGSPSARLTFDVKPANKLLYQEMALQDVTGKYSLEVTGAACASVQISQHYNIPTPPDVTTLSVKVEPEANCDGKSPGRRLTVKLQSLYSGKENSTNMVILDIKMLTGFLPNPESLKKLEGALPVDRVEQKEDHVLVYFQELPAGLAVHHSLELLQELPVQNLKPAVVKIYDYYQPSKSLKTCVRNGASSARAALSELSYQNTIPTEIRTKC